RAGGILMAASEAVAAVMEEVLRAEGPVHDEDLRARTLAAFGHEREGKRLSGALDAGSRLLRRRPGVERDGDAWRSKGATVVARCRATTGIPADRIAPWEYGEAV